MTIETVEINRVNDQSFWWSRGPHNVQKKLKVWNSQAQSVIRPICLRLPWITQIQSMAHQSMTISKVFFVVIYGLDALETHLWLFVVLLISSPNAKTIYILNLISDTFDSYCIFDSILKDVEHSCHREDRFIVAEFYGYTADWLVIQSCGGHMIYTENWTVLFVSSLERDCKIIGTWDNKWNDLVVIL